MAQLQVAPFVLVRAEWSQSHSKVSEIGHHLVVMLHRVLKANDHLGEIRGCLLLLFFP